MYSLVEFQLFMGDIQAFFPLNISTEMHMFIDSNLDHFYSQFVEFWGTHKNMKPCGEGQANKNNCCSTCMIVDGPMKIRRRICAHSGVSMVLSERFEHIFEDIIIGCAHSPSVKSSLCQSCKESGVKILKKKKEFGLRKKENTRRKKKHFKDGIDTNSMSEVRINLCNRDIGGVQEIVFDITYGFLYL